MSRELVLVIDDSVTVSKVVTLVLTKAGYEVMTAPDGDEGLAAARARRPALILLDFVMPRMNGYQFCRELADDAELRTVPVVLMSAKGDQVGERFVKVMGIVDYITKPFAPEAIVAVVAHTVAKYRAGQLEEGLPADVGISPDKPRNGGLERLHQALSRELPPGVLSLAQLETAARTAQLPLVGPVPGTAATVMMAGDLQTLPLAELLPLLDRLAVSGVLELRAGERALEIYTHQGRVLQALARGASSDLLLGRYVLDKELIAAAEFEQFVAQQPAGELLGRNLVASGALSERELRDCLARQSRELIYEAMRWTTGTFAMTLNRPPPPHAMDVNLGIDLEALLMEGFRRVDEWHLIERAIENFDQVFLRNEEAVANMGRGQLTREEHAVLELVNGKHTVKDIVRKSRLGSFEVSKVLFRLFAIHLIRRRVLPVAV